MSPNPRALRRVIGTALCTILLVLCACESDQPSAFEKAASDATDELLAQTERLPALFVKVRQTLSDAPTGPKSGVVIDPMLDTATGEQTTATTLLEKRVTERTRAKFAQFQFLPFTTANLGHARYLLTGTMTRAPHDSTRKVLRINLALTDLKTGTVVGQSTALAREEHIDNTPLRYYRDSPVLMKDKVIEGYVRTSASPAGHKADTYYLERVAAASIISDANSLYNAERYQEALGQYRNALATPAGEQLRTLSGIYLTSVKLGKAADAEQAFAKVVALGFAYNELGVKFLFNPGSTGFWSDPAISGAYAMWLRQIAHAGVAANACMNVVGHTSNSGPAAVNDALSLKRAAYVRQRLIAEAAVLASKTRATGMGFHQNIVGSGSDDAFDVLDRRVEFKIVPCS